MIREQSEKDRAILTAKALYPKLRGLSKNLKKDSTDETVYRYQEVAKAYDTVAGQHTELSHEETGFKFWCQYGDMLDFNHGDRNLDGWYRLIKDWSSEVGYKVTGNKESSGNRQRDKLNPLSNNDKALELAAYGSNKAGLRLWLRVKYEAHVFNDPLVLCIGETILQHGTCEILYKIEEHIAPFWIEQFSDCELAYISEWQKMAFRKYVVKRLEPFVYREDYHRTVEEPEPVKRSTITEEHVRWIQKATGTYSPESEQRRKELAR